MSDAEHSVYMQNFYFLLHIHE